MEEVRCSMGTLRECKPKSISNNNNTKICKQSTIGLAAPLTFYFSVWKICKEEWPLLKEKPSIQTDK